MCMILCVFYIVRVCDSVMAIRLHDLFMCVIVCVCDIVRVCDIVHVCDMVHVCDSSCV